MIEFSPEKAKISKYFFIVTGPNVSLSYINRGRISKRLKKEFQPEKKRFWAKKKNFSINTQNRKENDTFFPE